MSRRKEADKPVIRCAIYTRKSTEEGLEQEYNTLDAQRDAGEAYIASQRHEGWQCLPQRYDDGGFTGANMDRPSLRRLLNDIEAGKVDCVVVYKVDRLSRSLLDFGRMMETFDRHGVAFVSVTQAFNTGTSMGRLVLNVLLSFAQFEREMISERTRDKIAASRRKGKWSGGMPVLGYGVDQTKLIVDPEEAARVREIFSLYLDRESLLDVVKELNERNWRTKSWTTKKGIERGGRPFSKNSLYHLLTNVVYVGKVRYKDETHAGEHEPIVAAETFAKVQAMLRRNGHSGGRAVRNKHNALLRGLIRCESCGCGMSHTYSSKRNRQYRYYVCTQAQQRGWQECPMPSIPAGEIERHVIDQIRAIGRDQSLVRETLEITHRQGKSRIEELRAEQSRCHKELNDHHARLVVIATAGPGDSEFLEAQDRIRRGEQRLTEIEDELVGLEGKVVSEAEVAAALTEFDAVWACLAPKEQARIVELLVERVAYDAGDESLSIAFRPAGIKLLAGESVQRLEETVA